MDRRWIGWSSIRLHPPTIHPPPYFFNPHPIHPSSTGESGGSGAVGLVERPWKVADARLVLEDGSIWRAKSFGASGTQIGEVKGKCFLPVCFEEEPIWASSIEIEVLDRFLRESHSIYETIGLKSPTEVRVKKHGITRDCPFDCKHYAMVYSSVKKARKSRQRFERILS
ncbi:hypothetical protein RND71_014758 [Anisodus tanguticus]|uniref:Uncharacterized protein n=1 Tax=Anisodus tanguticus TaxID=243964 RepID=A0AAE1VED5_9SOLA|nr:hypothetical protein RND71_014758 [Anisodus tanguticus]